MCLFKNKIMNNSLIDFKFYQLRDPVFKNLNDPPRQICIFFIFRVRDIPL